MTDDLGFDEFCDDLNSMHAEISLFHPREGLTSKILSAARNDQKRRRQARLRAALPAFALAGVGIAFWLFFSTPAIRSL